MKYLILGGTGTLGQELTRQLIEDPENEVICFSRCEHKQKKMAGDFKGYKNLSFILGDIRDRDALVLHFWGVDTVFHVAALKHIDVLEDNPEECVKTNVIGTMNVVYAANICDVPHVVFSSTDKAVDPVNVYGMCKGVSEKILLKNNEIQLETKFSIFRWGNVLGSNGSVVHSFAKTLKEESKVYLTDPAMTRYWIRIQDAVKFILQNYRTSPRQEILVPPMKSATVYDLADTTAQLLNVCDYSREYIGLRKGEKIHECIHSMHSPKFNSSLNAKKYTRDELTGMVKEVLAL